MAELPKTHRQVKDQDVPQPDQHGIKRMERRVNTASDEYQSANGKQPGNHTMTAFTSVEPSFKPPRQALLAPVMRDRQVPIAGMSEAT